MRKSRNHGRRSASSGERGVPPDDVHRNANTQENELNPIRRIALLAALLSSAGLAAAPASAPMMTVAGVFDCPAPGGSGLATLAIEIDDSIPLAVVNEEDRPADYTPSHIRILLEPGGHILTIGRVTGRILASTPGSEPVLLGRCAARIPA